MTGATTASIRAIRKSLDGVMRPIEVGGLGGTLASVICSYASVTETLLRVFKQLILALSRDLRASDFCCYSSKRDSHIQVQPETLFDKVSLPLTP